MRFDNKPEGVPTGIKPGTKLCVTPINDKSFDGPGRLASSFENDQDDMTFVIEAPFFRSGLYPMRVDDEVRISFSEDKSRYEMSAVVIDRVKRENLYYIVLRRVGEIVRTQRRQDFRIDLMMDATLLQNAADERGSMKLICYDGQTANISGGGAQVRVNTPFHETESVMLKFHLPGVDEPLHFVGDVRWVSRRSSDSTYNFSCGLQFQFRSKSEKESLVKQLFRLQQQRMKTESVRPLVSDDWD